MTKPVNTEQQLLDYLLTDSRHQHYQRTQQIQLAKYKDSINRDIFQLSPTTIYKSPNNDKHQEFSQIKKSGWDMFDIISTNQKNTQKSSTSIPQNQQLTTHHDQTHTITSFNLVDKQQELKKDSKLPDFSLKLELLSINNYTFRLTYTYETQYRRLLSQQISFIDEESLKLINRIKKCMKRQPLKLFQFYNDVLSCYGHDKLRQFLIRNGVKYYSNQILILERLMDILLDIEKAQGILEYLFFVRKEDQELFIDLNFCSMSHKINMGQSNFWKALKGICMDRCYKNQKLGYQLHQISYFLRELL